MILILGLFLLASASGLNAAFTVAENHYPQSVLQAVIYSCVDGNMAVCESDDMSALYTNCYDRLFAPKYNISAYPELIRVYDEMFYAIAADVYPEGTMMK